jgi:protein-S-isoprenylcysteine O-methyltransferase Ste14
MQEFPMYFPFLLTLKIVVFLIGAVILIFLSRDTLRAHKSHGFYRFFAWISILALFTINVEHWFRDPFSAVHIAAWILLLISGYLVAHAFIMLRRHGRPDSTRQDVPLFEIEKTTELVTTGIYAYIRHPLYSSLLFLAWGIALKNFDLYSGLLALITTGFLIATARADEVESINYFGPAYEEYMQKTARFIPFIY